MGDYSKQRSSTRPLCSPASLASGHPNLDFSHFLNVSKPSSLPAPSAQPPTTGPGRQSASFACAWRTAQLFPPPLHTHHSRQIVGAGRRVAVLRAALPVGCGLCYARHTCIARSTDAGCCASSCKPHAAVRNARGHGRPGAAAQDAERANENRKPGGVLTPTDSTAVGRKPGGVLTPTDSTAEHAPLWPSTPACLCVCVRAPKAQSAELGLQCHI